MPPDNNPHHFNVQGHKTPGLPDQIPAPENGPFGW